MRIAAFALVALLSAGGAAAQDQQQTLADIRQELTVLHVEVQRLKRELSTTGAPAANVAGSTVLERVDAIEAELQRLTRKTEQLNARIDRVVADGSNRVGDLEFRLCELESDCDISQLPETSTLGGEAPAVAPPVEQPATDQTGGAETQLAVGEQADFDAATKAFEDGDYARAADLFAQFDQSYPGSPLAPQANLSRGRALEQAGDTREAARAFLASFTGAPDGAAAPEALYELGAALGRLGQTDQACVTLGEVAVRFPDAQTVGDARNEMAALGCS
ncbi:tol-pal system protein YbgF [Cribrihabitans marinus]|uniref:Cell division coordinator CpoB n=1 Tax=Cribrihabitans marinus TaxID=1227549 RepID=A0A1H7APQ1_9RHOB|nr:tol-pal system protein YbgF [Cribrihabitans marinus]GGH31930.1 tol-pal system protein YbgF [Cribrihabitans marinus]SEJ65817.1 tol-pal system protein YbgF [Cribrihabitans marinus]